MTKAISGKYFHRFILPVCLLLAVFLSTACNASGLNLPVNPLLPYLERKSGKIALVGLDGNIYTSNQGGVNLKPITKDASLTPDSQGQVHMYEFPTWSPDGKHMAFIGSVGNSIQLTGGDLYSAGSDGKNRVKMFSSTTVAPLFFSWSPDSQMITLLCEDPTTQQLNLLLIPLGGGKTETISVGDAIYWSWSPDSQTIAIHKGATVNSSMQYQLSIWEVRASTHEKKLNLTPTPFQAPSWSPSGQELMMAVQKDGQDELVTTDKNGNNVKTLGSYTDQIAFGWSPDGKHVAYVSGAGSAQNTYNSLTILDPQKPEKKTFITVDGLLGFFWSPDSKKLALFTSEGLSSSSSSLSASSGSQTLYRLDIWDMTSGKIRSLAEFQPTQTFSTVIGIFDQFRNSTTFWSPDSQNVVLTLLDDTTGSPSVYVLNSSGNLQRHLVSSGYLGTWSWQ